MVGDEHDVAHVEIQVDTAGGVGDDHGGAAQQAQHTHGVAHFFVGVALIMVHTALHDGHPLAGQGAEDQLALVAGGGGDLEVRNLTVRDGDGILYDVAHEAQAGAQDHQDLRLEGADLGPQGVGAFLIMGKGNHKV